MRKVANFPPKKVADPCPSRQFCDGVALEYADGPLQLCRLATRLSIFREELAITSVAAEVVPLFAKCSYKLRCLLFVAATACDSGGKR